MLNASSLGHSRPALAAGSAGCPAANAAVRVGSALLVPCRRQRRRHRMESAVRAEPVRAEQAPAPLSPPSVVPGASGISVQGFSPTSMQGRQIILRALQDANVKTLSSQEVVFAIERGVPIIDVRPADLYAKGHIPGARNVPFYQPIQGWEPMKIARRVGYALFGVFNGTEVNPRFTEEALPLVDAEKGAILYCAVGGSMEGATDANNKVKALQSRSLIAAYQLISNGAKNINILRGGSSEWVKQGRRWTGPDGSEEVQEAEQSQ